jgi:hypothetical protein
MMWTLQHARADGTFVVQRGGYPYHVTQADPLFPAVSAAAQGAVLPPEPVPVAPDPGPVTRVTMRQARLALLAAGLLDDVDAAVASASRAVQIEWEFSGTVERASPLVAAIAAGLSMDDAALDALFAEAARL